MQNLQIHYENHIAILTINRPKALNALNLSLIEEIISFLQTTAIERTLAAVILTGSGNKAFIAGADIAQISTFSSLEMEHFCKRGQELANALERAPFLTIAAVNGYALGGGLEMALACDMIVATTYAHFGLPEITLGLIPGFGGIQRLLNLIGVHRAKEWILTGKIVSAEEAEKLSIVNHICSYEELIPYALRIAQQIETFSHHAIVAGKQAINASMMLNQAVLGLERSLCAFCQSTEEAQQAFKHFLSKKGEKGEA